MEAKHVERKDQEFWMRVDKHADEVGFLNRVYTQTGYVLWEGDCPVGVMWYCVLWDNLPFLNFLFVKEEYRGNGFAAKAIKDWEQEMKKLGYKMLLISTQVDESAQGLYRKLGYVDCGGLLFDHTPFEQPMELFMRKVI